jgi:hypothetical protein
MLTVTGLKRILMNPSTPVERDDLLLPSAFVFDEDERVEARNRVEVGRFPLHIEVWVEGQDYARAAENLRADIKQKLYASCRAGAMHALAVACRETSSSKFYQELETAGDGATALGMGGVVLRYDVAYLTKCLDPYTQAGY